MSNAIEPWSDFSALAANLSQLHKRAHHAAQRSVDELLTLRNWLTGMWIVAYEQEGEDRAQYGEGLIDSLAGKFKEQGLRGFSNTNLRKYREIAMTWPRLAIQRTLSVELLLPNGSSLIETEQPNVSDFEWQDDAWMARLRTELSWSHFLELVRVPDATARAFYELETLKQHWSVRELRRQRESQLYERVGLSKNKDAVLALATEGTLTSTPDALVAAGGLDQQIFVSRYLTSLPDPEVLKRWLLDEREALEKA